MATPPYRITDRRSSSGYINTNTLMEAARQNYDRKTIPMNDRDITRSISSYGRRTLLTLGRNLFWNNPALQGAILEQANLSISTFIPQYTGRNKAWGEHAEEMLTEWHKIMDVAGWPYDYDSFLQGKVVNPLVDGEDFTLLTETPDGYPLIQIIPTHRIGGLTATNQSTAMVRFVGKEMWIDNILVDASRPYEIDAEMSFEASLIDGVVVDSYGRPLAYRVFTDNSDGQTSQDISARNLFPAFVPMVTGQVRGFSLLASSVFDWQDMHEWGRFEMLAQKAFATQTIVETNETGEVDTAAALIGTPATFDTDNKKTAPDLQTLDGGTIKYFKTGTGSKIESFHYDRPGASSQSFVNDKLRNAFKGTEWDVFFSLDPQAVGGAPMRIIVEKINAVIAKRQKLVAKTCRRVDGYALSKFITLGLLPPDDDWFRWTYQGPGEVTADKKYDSDVDLQEISQGITTRKLVCAKRGLYAEEVDEQRAREADSDLARASVLVKNAQARGDVITIQEALVILRPPSVSAQMPQPQQSASNIAP